MLSVPFVFSTSRFQGTAFRLDKTVVIVTLLAQDVSLAQLNSYSPFWEKHEAMEGIQDKDYNFLGNDKFPNLNERLLHERKT